MSPSPTEFSEPLVVTDGELLTQFSRSRDECAFAELVERHGNMVLGVCRQILRHQQDVEDAFQATFLILAIRSRHIRKVSSVGAWLYRVAYRTSMRSAKQRQNNAELTSEDVVCIDDSLERIHIESLTEALHEELVRLPSQYRDPLVLCYLENKTRQEAADQLESTESSVKARLARGRRMLRLGLAKRGIGLSVAVVTVNGLMPGSKTAISSELLESTIQICTSTTSLASPLPGLPSNTITLAKEGISTMLYSSLIKPLAVLTTAAAIAAGLAIQQHQVFGQVRSNSSSTENSDASENRIVAADSEDADSEAADSEAAEESANVFEAQIVAQTQQFNAGQASRIDNKESTARSVLSYSVSGIDRTASENNLERLRLDGVYLKDKLAAYEKLVKAMQDKSTQANSEVDKLEANGKRELYEAELKRIQGELKLVAKQIKQAKSQPESTGIRKTIVREQPVAPAAPVTPVAPPAAVPVTPTASDDIFGFSSGRNENNREPIPCCRTNNLAYKKNAVASSEESSRGNTSNHATDGDLNTRWCADGPQSTQWLVIDLEQRLNFKGIRIHWENQNTAYRYKILASPDAKEWETIADARHNSKSEHMSSHQVDVANARFVRIDFLGAKPEFWGSIREVEIASRKLSPEPNKEWARVDADDLFPSAVDSAPGFFHSAVDSVPGFNNDEGENAADDNRFSDETAAEDGDLFSGDDANLPTGCN